jgi:hypothetical protein
MDNIEAHEARMHFECKAAAYEHCHQINSSLLEEGEVYPTMPNLPVPQEDAIVEIPHWNVVFGHLLIILSTTFGYTDVFTITITAAVTCLQLILVSVIALGLVSVLWYMLAPDVQDLVTIQDASPFIWQTLRLIHWKTG